MTDLRYQKQKFKHDPDNGVYGDCARTAIACMFEMPRDDVPHFFDGSNTLDEFHEMDAWLLENGFVRVKTLFDGAEDVLTVIMAFSAMNPGLRFMLIGESKTGVNHIVICKDGKIDHDPSQGNVGIVAPAQPDGFYWVETLTDKRFVDV